jgi:glyoxylase-like metal-dependent hydrolase (beta-lactamase superfamily II)
VVSDGAEAAIIDPVLDFDAASGRIGTSSAQTLIDHVRAQGLTPRWLLETHAHADHLSASAWLKQQWPQASLAIGSGIRQVQAMLATDYAMGADFVADGSQFDKLLEDDEAFQLGDIQVRVIAVPGHTSDSVAYLVGDALFTGDSLFMPDAGSARCAFPGGDAATLYRSIRRLYDTLPEDTRVFVCHDYGPGGRAIACETSIGEQKRSNLHVREGIGEAEFVAMRRARDATLSLPALIRPALRVNLRGSALPASEGNDAHSLELPPGSL